MKSKRSAFTMIELLFVIVILGIVGGFALEAVRQYYDGIYRTQQYTQRAAEADQILEQISKYFENGISSSIVNLDRGGAAAACYGPPVSGDNNDYTVAFIGVDEDSIRGIGGRPGWSEETVLGANNTLTALDANYTAADTIIQALSLNNGSDLSHSAIYDAGSVDLDTCTRFNWNLLGGTGGYHRMDNVANPISSTVIQLNDDNNATDGHRKYLLRTGYAFRVNNGNFTMYSNFRPWLGERYTAAQNQNILGQNVAHFYADYNATDFQNDSNVSDRGLVWRLKVCIRGLDSSLNDTDARESQICRERRVHVRY
ncbi:hypothetical protein Sulku_0321 [Sulfuricurvum kujiense DSM 16994]|uniref:Uncharacterized protein n=1 Tax=Sulfuricurvum kujiense (strain ATCC BAA-921 / DSM 16994 / JCM 11577 / YK-1) TaxID=709032 RepID=E4TYL1_SULKY|nr:type II secretion system protein [Sulfuricurvum kujiense]ADR32988.1 hypothetical protein Sulku_0321 [Sulfuricurvum kujiense DSM 16994]